MKAFVGVVAAIVLAGVSGCGSRGAEIPSWRGPSFAHQYQLVREAEAFMADYARLLLTGDRGAIAALYDPDGAILIRNGRRTDASPADIAELYAEGRWQAPASFAWRELHYEAVGAEAVSVIGEFAWGSGVGPPAIGSYHALLRREDRRLAIRIENESIVVPAP